MTKRQRLILAWIGTLISAAAVIGAFIGIILSIIGQLS